MSQATLTFSLPEESHEFKAAAHAGDVVAAIQTLDMEFRRRMKYGEPKEQRLTAEQARTMLRQALADRGAEWALE